LATFFDLRLTMTDLLEGTGAAEYRHSLHGYKADADPSVTTRNVDSINERPLAPTDAGKL
jgi:hypothetical protein